ncbi:unnamed protein product [Prunus armeniaca]
MGSDRNWQEDSGIQSVVVAYFSKLFQSSTTGGSPVNLDIVEPRVTSAMNDSLMTEFTELEVKHAVFQMYPTNTPGPDGMPPLFYQKYWHIVGPDVSRAVIDFLSTGRLLRKVNFTQVVLVSKMPNSKNMTQLRPIRRLISDNSLLATEILHCLRRRRRGPKGFLALKLDMSKAYDRIEWTFLEQIMLKLGFTAPWVSLGFSAYLEHTEWNETLQGVSICRGAPPVPYLFFVNDCFLFARATLDNCRAITAALAWYESVSGQKVNFQKSAICFSKNVMQQAQRGMPSFLGVACVDQHTQYLGLPMVVGRNRSACFPSLKERLGKKLYSWRGKLLSGAGKEILIKTVAQALSFYTMSYGGERKIHWLARDKLCAPKDEGV